MHDGRFSKQDLVYLPMVLHVLAYNLTRVMNILGVKPLIAAIQT
jgi:hypothetical protein